MLAGMLAAVLCMCPVWERERECDVCEVNHVYAPDTGQHQFCQLIAWAWYEDGDPHVVWWCMIDREPIRLEGKRVYLVPKNECLSRVIRYQHFRVTHTLYDPEYLDRDKIRPEHREWQK